MGSSLPEKDNYFRLRLVKNEEPQLIKDIDDILLVVKECRRNIQNRIEYLESLTENLLETDREIAVLIRKDQYLQALEYKEKHELEEIFFPNGRGNCIIPDVFQWYQGPCA